MEGLSRGAGERIRAIVLAEPVVQDGAELFFKKRLTEAPIENDIGNG
jgi:hypothetical protein